MVRTVLILISLLLCSLWTGCQHRGHTDLYVDSMAAEIRDLEDQLYTYDHEYKLLEQELESLRRQQTVLSQRENTQAAPTESRARSSFDFLPRDNSAPSAIEPEPVPARSFEQSNANNQNGKSGEPSNASPPSILNPLPSPPQNPGPATDGLPPPDNRPSFPSIRPSTLPSNQPEPTDLNFDPAELTIPTITTGSLTPPTIDPKQIMVSPERDMELSLTRIEVPSQLASNSTEAARISAATQTVTDRRVVELAFQPALSRAVSFDDDQRDDGLYLVLLPKNELGQVVSIAARIQVEVIDPTRKDDKSVIATWNYSAGEVQSKIQPLGSKQGIHLTLPWNGPNPKSDQVLVIATMHFENGRTVVARKEFYLNTGNGLKTVWTPRGAPSSRQPSKNGPDDSSTSAVITASASADN